MNKIILWALEALVNGKYTLPNDPSLRKSLILAGLPEEEINSGILSVGKSVLESIFSRVTLENTNAADSYNRWIEWTELNPEKMPQPMEQVEEKVQVKIAEGKEVLEAILHDENIALAFLEKYATYLSISSKHPYLTFYDSIRNAAAIYACLEHNNWKTDFRLVGGDLSGIQNYIFDLSESHSKGVAKILRARSFYLGLFTQVVQHYIVHSLGVPLYCTIIDAGGRFLLLVPDDQDSLRTLEKINRELDEFCLENFNGELSLNLSFDVALNEQDFQPENLLSKIEELNCSLENKKNAMFSEKLISDNWRPEEFVFSDYYNNYDYGLCRVSEKLPMRKEPVTDDDEYESYSEQCYKNVLLGRNLVKCQILAFTEKKYNTKQFEKYESFSFPTFKSPSKTYYIYFLEDNNKISPDDFYLIQNLKGKLSHQHVPRYQANYVPTFGEVKIEDERFYPFKEHRDFSLPLKVEEIKDVPKKGEIVDFSTLAHAGVEQANSDSSNGARFIGSDLLGVIKADVDRMGQIFSLGIRDIFSLTSYATLSRQLNLFFTAYLPKIQEKEFEWIYTVYAGGDDLFLIGEWQQAIKLAQRLYQDFCNYTGKNEDITLSSAVYVMHPRHPIRLAAENAEELLKQAKENGRDSTGVFGIVVKQDKMENLMDMANFLYERRKMPDSESKINSGFLHRMIKYCSMAETFLNKNKVSELIYGARLSYDMGRNIIERDKKDREKIIKGEKEWNRLKHLTNILKPEEMVLMRFPLSWAILRNRIFNRNTPS